MTDRVWTFGSLFAGIGGFDVGLERAGWQCRWQVEINPFCQRVLAKHWPDVRRYGDVRAFPEPDTERVDLICGGFPCQPVSVAGKRRAQADERWLWPEVARVVRALRPRYVLLENVPGLLVANRGLAFGEVVGDLAASGYDAEWDCLPASAVGAPHRRDRVWIVAYANGGCVRGRGADESDGRAVSTEGEQRLIRGSGRSEGAVADAYGPRLSQRRESLVLGQRTPPERSGWWGSEPDVGRVVARLSAGLDGGVSAHEGCLAQARTKGIPSTARLSALRNYLASPAASSEPPRCALCGHPLSAMPCQGACAPWRLGAGEEEAEILRCLREGLLGLLAQQGQDVQPYLSLGTWATEREQAVGERVNRLRSLGNAIVPQVAEWIGRRLMEAITREAFGSAAEPRP